MRERMERWDEVEPWRSALGALEHGEQEAGGTWGTGGCGAACTAVIDTGWAGAVLQ